MAEDVPASAELAFARRDYESAATLFRASVVEADEPDRPRLMLRLAASLDRAGDPLSAWELCLQVASTARATLSATLLADAATTLRAADDLRLRPQVNLLCMEALAALPTEETARRARVAAVLTSTTSPWAREGASDPEVDDPETRFRELQADHAASLSPDHVHERLVLGDEAVALGRRLGLLEYAAWGLARRLDAMAQLGDRVGTLADLEMFAEIVQRIAEPSWTAHLFRVRSGVALWDGRLDEARELADQSLRSSPHDPRVQWLHLVLTENLARLDRRGLEEAESAVRRAVSDAPYFARGWLALTLVALDREAEARSIWAGLAPHVGAVPVGAHESLITRVGHAELCVALRDGDAAAATYEALVPWADLYACGGADTPSSGPVDLVLGRLSILRGDAETAGSHLRRALARAQSGLALPFIAGAHLALAELSGVEGRQSALAVEARTARDLAAAMGLVAIERAAVGLLGTHRRSGGLLTAREEEVVALVAADLTNRQIAERLVLSERTVENHMSHALAKTGLATRAGLAAWYVGLARDG